MIDQTERARIPSLQERFEEMELIVVELARRAESAEASLSLLIDSGTKQHEVLEGQIMPSESAPPHPSTAAPIHQIGDFNSDCNGLAQSQRYSSNTTRSKVEFNVFPPDGPEGISTESCDKDLALSEFYRSINSRQAYTEILSANRNKAELMSPHEGVGHRRVTGTDNGVTKKSPAVRKLVKATSKSKSIGSTITASKVKSCPPKIDSMGKDCDTSRTAIELTPRTISHRRNVSLGSDYGNYIREVKSALPNNSMKKCTPSVLREKNRPLGHKSRSVPRFESSPSPSMDTQRQRNSNATRNLVETRKSSTKHYDLGRGDGAPMINLATFHPRQQASPYRSRSAAPSSVLERYISTPIMKSSARGATTTPSVIERAGRHKLQVRITTYSNVTMK